MSIQHFRYVLDLCRAGGGAGLGQFPVSVDLDPVAEWGRFAALRQWVDPRLASEAEIRIGPVWHAKSGAPYADGLRVTAQAEGAPSVSVDIPASYFRPNALRIADSLVAEKKLEAGEQFTYAVLAFPASGAENAKAGNPLDIEELPVPVNLAPGSIDEEVERSIAFGDLTPGLVPIFVPQQVIEEVMALAERAAELEVGAVLIGKLHRDGRSNEVFLKVTAQIPARHTLSESTKVSFTAETWAAAQAAVNLRRSKEEVLGWAHNHPARYWCNKECAPEAKQRCPLAKPFFSIADCDFHRVAFCKPHCIALLLTNNYTGMKLTMYGWDRAIITQRGFHIIKADAARLLPAVETASLILVDHHETSCHP